MRYPERRRTRIPLVLATVLLGAGQGLFRLDVADFDLSGANLAGANLFGVDLTGANLAGVRPQLVLIKTALSAPTDRFLGGGAPSTCLRRLQDQQKLDPEQIDALLRTHFIDPAQLRADDLPGMMVRRRLVTLTQTFEAHSSRCLARAARMSRWTASSMRSSRRPSTPSRTATSAAAGVSSDSWAIRSYVHPRRRPWGRSAFLNSFC